MPVRRAGEGAKTESIAASRAIFRSLQRSDLNLLAAYRRIPLLEHRPARIAFTRARTRSVYRKSRENLLDLLHRSERPAASADRPRVRACRDRWFGWVKERYENVRANVWYAALDTRGRGRVQIAAGLPIVFAPGRSDGGPRSRIRSPTSHREDVAATTMGRLAMEKLSGKLTRTVRARRDVAERWSPGRCCAPPATG